MNSQFMQFYKDLYALDSATDNTITQWLDGLELKGVEETDKVALDQPITVEEILNAITRLKSGKAPGPDVFPVKFYKKFAAKMAPFLLEVYGECFETKTLPTTMAQATISVFLKKDKDPSKCESYRAYNIGH